MKVGYNLGVRLGPTHQGGSYGHMTIGNLYLAHPDSRITATAVIRPWYNNPRAFVTVSPTMGTDVHGLYRSSTSEMQRVVMDGLRRYRQFLYTVWEACLLIDSGKEYEGMRQQFGSGERPIFGKEILVDLFIDRKGYQTKRPMIFLGLDAFGSTFSDYVPIPVLVDPNRMAVSLACLIKRHA